MHQAELLGQMVANRPRTITLSRMVATGQIGHAALTRVVGLRLGNFAGDKGLRPGCNGRL